MVESELPKLKVAGSNPVARSNIEEKVSKTNREQTYVLEKQ